MKTDRDNIGNDVLMCVQFGTMTSGNIGVDVCPVWNDDQWLKQHSGATLDKTEEGETEEGNSKRSQEEVDNVCHISKQFFPKLSFESQT